MLDPKIFVCVRVGPTCNVTGGKNTRYAGFEVLVNDDAPVSLQAGALGQLQPRPYANSDDD